MHTICTPLCTPYAHHMHTNMQTNMQTRRAPICTPICTPICRPDAHQYADQTRTSCRPFAVHYYPSYYAISDSVGDCCSFFFIFHFLIKGRKHPIHSFRKLSAPFAHHSRTRVNTRPPLITHICTQFAHQYALHMLSIMLSIVHTRVNTCRDTYYPFITHHTILSPIHSGVVDSLFLSFISYSKEENILCILYAQA